MIVQGLVFRVKVVIFLCVQVRNFYFRLKEYVYVNFVKNKMLFFNIDNNKNEFYKM